MAHATAAETAKDRLGLGFLPNGLKGVDYFRPSPLEMADFFRLADFKKKNPADLMLIPARTGFLVVKHLEIVLNDGCGVKFRRSYGYIGEIQFLPPYDTHGAETPALLQIVAQIPF